VAAPDVIAEPSEAPLRFSDVMDELALVRALAVDAGPGADQVADGCLRLEALFDRLRRQFLRDVVIGRPT
jgi:hypothetical protein